jgi:hypothetical protein
MSTFNFFIKSSVVVSVLLLSNLGCRKDIDFDKQSGTVISPIDPTQPIYSAWEKVDLSFSGTPLYVSTSANGNYMFVGTTSTVPTIGDRVYSISQDFTNTPMFSHPSSNITGMAVGTGGRNLSFMNNSSFQAIQAFNQTGIIETYVLGVNANERINDIYDDGGVLYIGGEFNGIGNNPTSDFVDKLNKTTTFTEGMHGIVSEVYSVDNFVGDIYVCGDSILPTGHSIAVWDFTQWLSYGSVLNEKVSDITFYHDTMFIAGYSGNGYAIRKGFYGSITEDQTLINTSPTESATKIEFFRTGDRLFVYGTVNLPGLEHEGVLEYKNGTWDYVGSLEAKPSGLVLFKGYLYALVNGKFFRYQI